MKRCLLFVYGTLKKGKHNNHILQNSELLGEFRTERKYTLFDGGFPIVERSGNDSIEGELYLCNDENVISNVFNLEGCESQIQGDPESWYDYDKIDTPHGEAIMFVMNKGESQRTLILKSGVWN